MSFENFPYTDFHALNLDWIVKIVKECKELTGETAIGLSDLKKYVNDYFSDLNVQVQINNKLDAMEADGSLAEIINQDIFSGLNTEIAATATTIKKVDERYFNIKYFSLYDSGLAALIDFYDGNGIHKYALYDGGVNTNSAYPFYYAAGAGRPNDAETAYNGIVAMGVTHLDYAFVSHFHLDHVGALGYAIQNGMINSASTIYIGGYIDSNRVDNSTGEYTTAFSAQSQLQGLATQYNLNVVVLTSSTTLNICETKIRFMNASDSYEYIYTLNPTNPNFFSCVAEFSLGNQKHMIASDIPPEIQEHIQPACKKVNVIETPHHASDKILCDSFAETVNPDVFLNSYGTFVKDVCSKSAWLPKIRELVSKCYLTLNNDVSFNHSIYGFTVNNPAPDSFVKTAYCDGYFVTHATGTGKTTLPVKAFQNNGTLFDVDEDAGIFTCKKTGFYLVVANFNVMCPTQSTPFKTWSAIRGSTGNVKALSQHLTMDNVWANVSAAMLISEGDTISFSFENASSTPTFTIGDMQGNLFKIILLN